MADKPSQVIALVIDKLGEIDSFRESISAVVSAVREGIFPVSIGTKQQVTDLLRRTVFKDGAAGVNKLYATNKQRLLLLATVKYYNLLSAGKPVFEKPLEPIIGEMFPAYTDRCLWGEMNAEKDDECKVISAILKKKYKVAEVNPAFLWWGSFLNRRLKDGGPQLVAAIQKSALDLLREAEKIRQ